MPTILRKDHKKQVAYTVVLTPDMTDTDKDNFTVDSIEDAAHDWMIHSQRQDLFHDEERELSKSEAPLVINEITHCDFMVNLEDGSIKPLSLIAPEDLDRIIMKSEGDNEKELLLANNLLKDRIKEYKIIKKARKERKIIKIAGKEFKIIRKGSWIIATKFLTKELWEDVENKTLRAVSIYGEATEFEEVEE